MDLAKATDYYIRTRDKISEIEKRHKDELKPLKEALDKLNTQIIDLIQQTGGNSVNIKGVGTAYLITDVSVSIADPGEFKRHVIGSEAWDLIDWRANKTAVNDFLTEQHGLPPGINYSTRIKAGVRRD